ncbi:hypothetical protein PC129_g2915 [Phytophthora cactorum]|uniref:Uncharacterized protein n=1 Tax=Phytophthora cactorum TaxID=29920 RepID=A0A8T1IP83_9STRA|nr:hypothetical protein PC129_g2915 [Phytophthora cactorum]
MCSGSGFKKSLRACPAGMTPKPRGGAFWGCRRGKSTCEHDVFGLS